MLGDSSSYFIGRRYGEGFFRKEAWVLNLKNYKKGQRFFEKYGPRAVLFARFLGPLSWVTPFLAGVYKLPYRTFLPYSILGVIGGIGQFIIVGYFFGNQYEAIFALGKQYWPYAVLIILVIAALYYHFKKR
jgi:membrane-associated protein